MGIIIGSKTRIKKLEDRVVKLEATDRVTHIKDQAQACEQLKERFDRLEASISLRTEHIAQGLDSLPAKMAEEIPQKAESSRSSKVSKRMSKKSYHTVSAGETLYGISLRYGLTVQKMRLLNKLSDKFVICPGQKLLVTL